jgi:Myb-like DNA-binding domain
MSNRAKKHWTEQEDAILGWEEISKMLPGRTPQDCRDQWIRLQEKRTEQESASQPHNDEDDVDNGEVERRKIKQPPTDGQGRRRRLGTLILSMVINMAAVLCSVLANRSCHFLSLPEEILTTTVNPPIPPDTILFGSANESPFDDITPPFLNSPFGELPFLTVTQWAAVLAPVLGGIAFLVQLVKAFRL